MVVDPPRKGCDPLCLETMLQMRPDRIVYVSCDSAIPAPYRDTPPFPYPAHESHPGFPRDPIEYGFLIVPGTECYLGPEVNKQILEIIVAHMEKYHVSAYDETIFSEFILTDTDVIPLI